MQEVNKPNDIFVSTLLNPTSNVEDLIENGINGKNTGLLDPNVYKESEFVKKAFTDDKGTFNNEAFTNAYNIATQKYLELQSIKTYDDLNEYVKYDKNDIYAPLDSNKTSTSYELKRVKNPFQVSEGVTSIFGKGESDKSWRELAQQHKVWDSENNKWLDYTAEDQGFLGLKYLGRQSLVYAKWGEDGTHFDPSIGREVKHKKGDLRTDENGMFFTETIGNKQAYDQEFVAYSDILTKEDSWANKIDFFDSDDKEKSITGTVMKTIATIAPYFVPGVRSVWGGITAAIGLSSVMPTFAKMAEGVVIGDRETGFTRAMSAAENYFKKFNPSHSDKGNQSMLNFETTMDLVGDIFGQLYQMRAAASLSNLFAKNMTKSQKKSYENFVNKFGAQWAKFKEANPQLSNNPDEFYNLWKELASNTPEMKSIIDKQTKLSKQLSLGYMALTSSADVYEDAINHGYDRRMAGFAGLAATAGQYAIMMNNRMGDWFLDATVGYKENVSRNVMRKTLQPYYDKIADATKKLAVATTKEEKSSIIANTLNTIFKKAPSQFMDILKYGGEEYWKKALIEGVEEVTEEAVMDATKGVFDFLSYIGVGKNAGKASFGGIDNVFSSEGAQRYLMNFVGGVLGGALFEFQGKVVEPAIDALISKKAIPEVRYSIIKEIMNGNTQELLDEIDRMTKADNELLIISDNQVASTNNNKNQKTSGEVIAATLKDYVKFVEGIIMDNGIKLDDSSILSKAVRDRTIQPLIEQSGLLDMISSDFTKMIDEFVSINADIQNLNPSENPEEPSAEQQLLKQKYNTKKQEILDFLNGAKQEEYLKTALLYLHPNLRNASLGVDKYSWAKAVYNVDYSSLPQSDATLSKQQIDSEYAEWKSKANDLQKFRTIGVKAFDELEKEFSSVFKEYAESQYKNIRRSTFNQVLSSLNFSIGEDIKSQEYRDNLIDISKLLSEVSKINLEDSLQLTESVQKKIVDSLTNTNTEYFKKIADTLNQLNPQEQEVTIYDISNLFQEQLISTLQSIPANTYSKETINSILQKINKNFASIITQGIFKENEDISLQEAKIKADKILINLGFSPINQDLEGVDPKISILNYIQQITQQKINQDIDISNQVLQEYIDNNDTIDNEVIIKIKNDLYRNIEQVYKSIINQSLDSINSFVDNEVLNYSELTDEDVETYNQYSQNFVSLKNSNLDIFLTKLKEGLNNNLQIEEIIEDYLFNESDGVINIDSNGYKLAEKAIPNLKNYIKEEFNKKISSIPNVDLYRAIIQKSSESNPLFDKLREFKFKVFDGDDLKIFDLLEAESQHMSQIPDLGEYIRQGITKESIDNFIAKLELLKSIAIAMEDTQVSPDKQIAYNIQMRRWNEKWGGKNADLYQTLSTQDINQIIKELDLLQNKLQFAKTLIETNTESKLQENQKSKENFENYILQCIEKAGSLTIKGVSILPPKDELEKLQTDSEKLGLIEHTLYQKIQELLENNNHQEIIYELFDAFGIDSDFILKSGLMSYGLNSTQTTLSPYDFFVWLTTVVSTDSNEFLYKYKEILKQDSYKYVPFFIQEYSAKTLYSFVKDKNKIHNLAVDWLYKDTEVAQVQKTSQIFFLNGIAGAGKTTAVMSLVAAMIGANNYFSCAPNTSQAEKLDKSLGVVSQLTDNKKVFNKQQLLEYLLTDAGIDSLQKANETVNKEDGCIKTVKYDKDFAVYRAEINPDFIKELEIDKVPQVIFIDEITHFNIAELIALDTAAKKYNIKIVTAGDTLQRGALINNIPSNINDVFAWKSPALLISVRSTNIHKKDNTDLLQSILRQLELLVVTQGYNLNSPEIQSLLKEAKTIKYYQDNDTLQGDKLVDEITVEDLKLIAKAAKGKSIAIISKLDVNGRPDSNFLAKLEEAGLSEEAYELYSPDDYSSKAVQGSEADYVIINDMPDQDMDNYVNLSSLYTYLTRSQIGSLVRIGGYKGALNLITEAVPYTSDYTMPGVDQQVVIKDQKIQEIDSIIKDYTLVEEKFPTKEQSQQQNQEQEIEENLSDEEQKEIQQVLTQAEESQVQGQHPIYVNPYTWKPDGLYGYSFYNRGGIKKTQDTNTFYSVNTGTSLDLDGLFKKSNIQIQQRLIRGFIKFKNLITLYNQDSDNFKQGIQDRDILYFFWNIIPEISDAKNEEDRQDDTLKWLIGDESTEGHLHIDPDIYIFAKKYDKSTDASIKTVESDPNALKDSDIWMGFGKRIYCTNDKGQIIVNQYITSGALPKIKTLQDNNIDAKPYIDLYNKAKEAINKEKRMQVFRLPKDSELKSTIGLQIRQSEDPGRFISLAQMQNEYGISLLKDSKGNPAVYLIGKEDNKVTINGVSSYKILHFMAQAEESPLSYAERIHQLEKAFVQNGKLTISGKYWTIASFTSSDDKKYQRVLILEPSGFSFLDALNFQKDLTNKRSSTESDKAKQGLLELKAAAMSQASQIRLLKEMFKTLNAIDENGNAKGQGVLPYVQYTLEYLQNHSESNKLYSVTVDSIQQLIDVYKDKGLNYDMSFISQLLKKTRYGGIFLIDQHLSVSKDHARVKKLPEAGATRRDTIDLDPDFLDQKSFKEFGVKYAKVSKELDSENFYEAYQIYLSDQDYNYIGLSGHFIEMPKFNFTDKMFTEAKLLSNKEATLSIDAEINYDNLNLQKQEKKEKLEPTTGSFKELAKTFNPDTDIKRTIKSKKKGEFYHYKKHFDKEMYQKLQYSPKTEKTNGFKLRVGDYIQIYGDITHTYRISYIDFQHEKFEFDLKDGNTIEKEEKKVPFNAVSDIVGRTMMGNMKIEEDFYQKSDWIQLCRQKQKSTSKKSIIVYNGNLTNQKIENLLKNFPTLVFYPVLNSDESVLSKLQRAQDSLTDGFDLSSIDIYPADSVEAANVAIQQLSDIEDLNGIAVVGILKPAINDFITNKKKFIEGIQESYIKQYISFNDSPKLIEEPKPIEKEEETKLKVKKEVSQLDKFIELLNSLESLSDGDSLIKDFISTDTVEELSDFSNTLFFKYKDGDKWYLYPKLKLLNKLSEEKKQKLISLIPKTSLNIGDQIEMKLDSKEGTRIYTLIEILPEEKYKFVENGNPEHVIEKDKIEFDLLKNKKYSILEASKQTQEQEQLNLEQDQVNPEEENIKTILKDLNLPDSTINELLPNIVQIITSSQFERDKSNYLSYMRLCFQRLGNTEAAKELITVDFSNQDDIDAMRLELEYISIQTSIDNIENIYDEDMEQKFLCQ